MTAVDVPIQRPEPARDSWGRYKIPHPTTGKLEAWTRVTTFAKALDDDYALIEWRERQVVIGLGQRPDLVMAAAAARADDKAALAKIVDQAKEAAASSARATLGTALHTFTERADLGEAVRPPAPYDADVAAYLQALAAHQVGIRREWVEVIVCNTTYHLAGTADRIVEYEGELVIADLKTGRNLDYSWGTISIQLAMYATAQTIYDPATNTHHPMPKVSTTRGLVFHVSAGTGQAAIYEVDIAAGTDGATHVAWVRDTWRKRKDLATLVGPTITTTLVDAGAVDLFGDPVAAPAAASPPPATRKAAVAAKAETVDLFADTDPEMPVAAAKCIGCGADIPPGAVACAACTWDDEAFAGLPTATPPAPLHTHPVPLATEHQPRTMRRANLAARAAKIRELGGADRLAALWPAGVQGLKGSYQHSLPELDRIEAALIEAERQTEAPFDPPPPVPEGDDVDAATLAALKAKIEALDPVAMSYFNERAAEATAAKVSLSLRNAPTLRRWAIVRSLALWAPFTLDDVHRSAIALVTGAQAHTLPPTGAALGALTYDEANRLADVAYALSGGAVTLAFDANDVPVIQGADEVLNQFRPAA